MSGRTFIPGSARTVAIAVALLALPESGAAQMTRGSIAGTARDATGGVLPGVAVTVTSETTGARASVYTDRHGFYRMPALEPAAYLVVLELNGFQTLQQRHVAVRPALETALDIVLHPAGVGEVVEVAGGGGMGALNKGNATIATTVPSRAVVDLPLGSGRDINGLVLTVPNATQNTGQGGGLAINGNRPRHNNFMVDGSDNNDLSVTVATSQIVPEAVAEFQVLQNPYSVEFGRNSGGQVNVITRSGGNRLTGDVFDYYQSGGLNSLSNIEKASGLTTPPKRIRHQLGTGVGGPVLRDRLFFFGLYQRDSQRPAERPSGTTIRIPTESGYAQLLDVPLRPGQSAASRQAVLQRLAFLPEVYAAAPSFRNVSATLVNGVAIETGQTNLPVIDPSLYHTWLGRGDFRPGARDTLTLRYSLNDRMDEGIAATGFGPRFMASQDLRDTNLAAAHAHIFSPSMLNEVRVSFVGRDLNFPENDPDSPTATVTGLFQLGGASNFPTARVTKAYQLSDVFTWSLARHTLKAGVDVRHNDVFNQTAFNSKGNYTFNSLQDFMNNSAFQVLQALQTASWQARQWQAAVFLQDDVRLTADLSVNVGLRYERSQVPLGMFGARDAESLAARVPPPVKVDGDNWAPRVGFAYSPRARGWLLGDGRTVFRGGYGVGYDLLFYNLLIANASNYPRIVTLQQLNVLDVYPARVQGSAAAVFNPLATYVNSSPDTQNPESRFSSLTVQREVGAYVFEAGYSGSRGARGINQVDLNPAVLTPEQAAMVRAGEAIPSVQARRLDPTVGSRTTIPVYVGPGGNDVEARSQYDAFFVSASRRLSRGFLMNGAYTFSRWMSNNDAALAEGGTESASQRPQNFFDYGAEWSRSVFDRPHRLAVTYVWEMPGPRTGVLAHALGGWQLAGITTAQSGRPFTITTGVDSNGDGTIGSDRPDVNPAGAFVWDREHRNFTNAGYYTVPLGSNGLPLAASLGHGNAPRNSERTAGFWNTDLSLMKRFRLANGSLFAVRIDAFNVLNQDNYGGAPGTTVPASFANMASPSFGQNNNDWGRRTIQLGGKLSF